MTKKDGRGRATVMTEQVIDKLEEAFSWGCSDVEACLWAGIAPATLYKYQERNPDFAERKAELKETPILLARKTVISGVKKDPKLALDFLGRKAKKEFGTNVDITTNGKELPTPILGGLTKQDALQADNSTE